jgi:hypothetical protein
VDSFPVLTGQFGYTRGDPAPGQSHLRTYRERNGDYTVYGEVAQTEALFIRLDPISVLRWLRLNGLDLPDHGNSRDAAEAILQSAALPTVGGAAGNAVGAALLSLVHSYAHRFIRQAAVFAGIERTALSELLMPLCFGFFVYAASRGDFVLGGLQALFEGELDTLLNRIVDAEHRCALDPGCEDNGGACAVCLHLGEPSCRLFNTSLSRHALAGDGLGYFDVTAPT